MGKLVVSHVGKAYKRYASKWARMLEWVTGKPRHDKTWVLRDIHFTVNPGEAAKIGGRSITGVSGPSGWVKSTTLTRPFLSSSTNKESTVTGAVIESPIWVWAYYDLAFAKIIPYNQQSHICILTIS